MPVCRLNPWFDRKVSVPLPSNACFGFDATTGWTFFDLNALHDEWKDAPGSVIEADFYHANQLLPMNDEDIIAKVHRDLTTCVPQFHDARVIDSSVIRLPKRVFVNKYCESIYELTLKSVVKSQT